MPKKPATKKTQSPLRVGNAVRRSGVGVGVGVGVVTSAEKRAAHYATHATLRAHLELWLDHTERLPHSPDAEVYDSEGRLWLRNCKVCGSTISRAVKP